MDCGVIAMVKKSYRYKLLQRFFDIFDTRAILRANAIKAKMKAGTMGLSEGRAPHLHEVKYGKRVLLNLSRIVGRSQL
jgi:hypothetical protein